MAVQITSDSSSVLFQAQQATHAAAARRVNTTKEGATSGVTGSSSDSARISSQPKSAGLHEAAASLDSAQRGMGMLTTAGRSLNLAAKQISALNEVVAAGNTDAKARLAVADGVAALDRVLNAKFEGVNVLDGTEFSVATGGNLNAIKVQVGNDTLRNLPSLLASGGRGFNAIDLEQPAVAGETLNKAASLIRDALGQVSSQAGTLQALFARVEGQIGTLSGAAPLTAAAAPAVAKDAAAAIGAAAVDATKAQATIPVEAAQRLLVG